MKLATLGNVARGLLMFGACSACGYHAIHGGETQEKMKVDLGTLAIPDAIAADEVVAGARESLSREGALGGSGELRLVVDVTRIDETADAIAAPRNSNAPLARAEMIAVVGRASVLRGGKLVRDTGDMRASALVAVSADSHGDSFVHDEAVRAAARRLGQKLALRAIGEPVTSEDGEGRLP